MLRVPDCSLTDAALPKAGESPEGYLDFFTSLQFASPEGAAIIEQMDRRTSRRTWSMLADPRAALQSLAASSDRYQSPPVLSHQGDAVAYLETVVGSGPPVLHRVQVRKATPESAAPEVDVDLAPLGPASYVLMDVETETREILVWRDDRPLAVGFDGQSRPIPFKPGFARSPQLTFEWARGGWRGTRTAKTVRIRFHCVGALARRKLSRLPGWYRCCHRCDLGHRVRCLSVRNTWIDGGPNNGCRDSGAGLKHRRTQPSYRDRNGLLQVDVAVRPAIERVAK